MTPEERELRRALDSRSAEVTPEFRARLSSALSEGRPSPSNFLPALAAVAAVVLMVATVGVLLLARQARTEPSPVAAATPTATPSTQPTPTPGSAPVAGVLNKPPGPIPLPADAQATAPSASVLWTLMNGQFLYRSVDQGKTWQPRPLPPSLNEATAGPEISFVSDIEGWLSTVPYTTHPTPCSAGQMDALWHTADAGTTWQQVLRSHANAGTQCDYGLSFIDPQRGFLSASDPTHAPVIYRTSDGGQTWAASKPMPDPPGFKTQGGVNTLQPGRVSAFGSTLLVPASSGNGAQYVFGSTDGGATWSYLAQTRAYGTIVLITASRWIQLLPPGGSRETTDAGVSWHPYPSDYSQAAPIAPQVVFADSRVGYATVRGAIARTLDGGLHWSWTAVKSPGT